LFNGYKMYFKQNWSVLSCKSYKNIIGWTRC
jgi:hypothetical protein